MHGISAVLARFLRGLGQRGGDRSLDRQAKEVFEDSSSLLGGAVMRKLGLILGVLSAGLIVTSTTWAISGGPGGTIYWSSHNPTMPWYRPIIEYNLRRVQVDGNWDNVGVPETFDTLYATDTLPIPVSAGVPGDRHRFDYFFGNNGLEVFDPRDEGGQGRVMRANIVNDTPGGPFPQGDPNEADQPWDIALADPANPGAANQVLLCDGKMPSAAEWDTQALLRVLVAPKNWTTHLDEGTLSLVTGSCIGEQDDPQTGKFCHVWDANGNGVIDNVPAEGVWIGDGGRPTDVETDDDALWVSSNKGYLGNDRAGGAIERWWRKSDGTYHKTVYFDYDGIGEDLNNPVGYATTGAGIAVGPSGSAPIVYLIAHDQTDIGGGHNNLAIFALRDGDGDNIVDYTNAVDNVVTVWAAGDLGLNVTLGYASDCGQDLEVWVNPDNGDRLLFFNDYDGELFVLELAENGVLAVDGKMVLEDMRVPGESNFYRSGFELDLNPIPEPGTVLLIATGLFGLAGVTRRRRMR